MTKGKGSGIRKLVYLFGDFFEILWRYPQKLGCFDEVFSINPIFFFGVMIRWVIAMKVRKARHRMFSFLFFRCNFQVLWVFSHVLEAFASRSHIIRQCLPNYQLFCWSKYHFIGFHFPFKSKFFGES